MKKAYLRSVRALLDCPPQERKRLMKELDRAVSAYLEDVPDADEAQLWASFGTPAECAARLLAECDPERMAGETRKWKKRQRVLAAAFIAVLLLAIYLFKNGGIVTIKLEDHDPEYWKNLPSDHIIYTYED